MKAFELLELIKPTIDKIAQSNISVQDIQHLSLFRDYQNMVSDGHKKTYIIAHLGDVYKLKTRRIRYIISNLSKEV